MKVAVGKLGTSSDKDPLMTRLDSLVPPSGNVDGDQNVGPAAKGWKRDRYARRGSCVYSGGRREECYPVPAGWPNHYLPFGNRGIIRPVQEDLRQWHESE